MRRRFGVGFLLLATIAAHAEAPAPLSPLVGPITVGPAAIAGIPAIAMDATGNFVVATLHADFSVALQRFRADGLPAGTAFPSGLEGDQGSPAIASTPDGRFVVARTGCDADNHLVEVVRWFAADGTALTDDRQANPVDEPCDNWMFELPQVGIASDGTTIVAWARSTGSDHAYQAEAQLFGPDHAPRGDLIRPDTTRALSINPRVAMSLDGSFVVAWSGSTGFTDTHAAAFARRYDRRGKPLARAFRPWPKVDVQDGALFPAVAMAPDGSFVMAALALDTYGLKLRRFSADGVAGESVELPNVSSQPFQPPTIALDAIGHAVAGWRNPDNDVAIARFSFDGEATVGPVVLKHLAQNEQPSIAVDADGDTVATFLDWSADPDGFFDGYVQRFAGFEPMDLSIAVTGPKTVAPGDPLAFEVRVRNRHGHVAPTGQDRIDAAIGSAHDIVVRLPADTIAADGPRWRCRGLDAGGNPATCRYDANLFAATATSPLSVAVATRTAIGAARYAWNIVPWWGDATADNDRARREVTIACPAGRPVGQIAVTPATQSAGESAGGAHVDVVRTDGSCGDISVQLKTVGDSATTDDFGSIDTVIAWANGVDGASGGGFTMSIAADTLDEPDESVDLALTGISGIGIDEPSAGRITIADDDVAPEVAFTSSSASVGEGADVALDLALTAPSGRTISVPVVTTSSVGSATPGKDYTLDPASGTVEFVPGQTQAHVTIHAIADAKLEAPEFVYLSVGTPANATAPAGGSKVTVTIDNR